MFRAKGTEFGYCCLPNVFYKQHHENDREDFMDQLTKEEKEAMLNRKMEEMRRRNQELQMRHQVAILSLLAPFILRIGHYG